MRVWLVVALLVVIVLMISRAAPEGFMFYLPYGAFHPLPSDAPCQPCLRRDLEAEPEPERERERERGPGASDYDALWT